MGKGRTLAWSLGALGQDIIRQQNLDHFCSLLRKTSHRGERMLLLMLLAEAGACARRSASPTHPRSHRPQRPLPQIRN